MIFEQFSNQRQKKNINESIGTDRVPSRFLLSKMNKKNEEETKKETVKHLTSIKNRPRLVRMYLPTVPTFIDKLFLLFFESFFKKKSNRSFENAVRNSTEHYLPTESHNLETEPTSTSQGERKIEEKSSSFRMK